MTARIGARKALGQHWLTDRRYLSRIAAAADFSPEDTVIEVGAGTGTLTEILVQRASRLIALEVDPRLAEGLRDRFRDRGNVAVVEGDVLEIPVEELLSLGGGGLPYVVVGNLPYFIGSAIVRKFLQSAMRPRWMVVTLQEEVARSMAATPGKMSYLSVQVQLFAEARVLFRIPPRAFRPAPKVQSAVLRLDVHEGPAVEVDDVARFLDFVRAGFAAPRKHLRNSLAIGLQVSAGEVEAMTERAGVGGKLRPADLCLSDWRALYFAYRAEAERL